MEYSGLFSRQVPRMYTPHVAASSCSAMAYITAHGGAAGPELAAATSAHYDAS